MLWPARVPPDTPGYGWLAKEDTGPRIPFSFTSSHSIELHGGRCVAAASGRAPLTERARVRTSRERHCCSVANCLFAMRIFPERVPLEAETRVGKARFLFLCYVHFFFLYVCFGSSQTASVPRASVHMRSRSPFSASEDSRRRVGGRIHQSVFR